MIAATRSGNGMRLFARRLFKKTPRIVTYRASVGSPAARFLAAKANDSRGGDGFSIWYPIVGGFVVATLGGLKSFHDHVGGTEGLWRSASFYSYAIPKYIEYRYHAWRKSPDEVWDSLNQETSQGALEKIRELKGFYIKSGQLAAANIGDAFPEIWQNTMVSSHLFTISSEWKIVVLTDNLFFSIRWLECISRQSSSSTFRNSQSYCVQRLETGQRIRFRRGICFFRGRTNWSC
jgi:hypothetical protein